ncbi:two component transcriptional regulator, LytTR family [Zhouia amylolytica]|uniref:Two component transcriptional regulator, LytTR family n=1 Tax=Zhouia amylolytica TaxID=376730 RepID=A0A1I6S7G4_9FLAO|nr:LytTR family DNA-binding domain-containing protein [Zhouia amylolytica]SFS72876.1 two component transcriptional regulator, LytTR family [Zhouia amylolytica]
MKTHNTSISCLLLEDDAVLQAGIKQILREQYPEITLHLACNLKEAALCFYKYQPELLLFDINLPDGNSFELLEDFHKNRKKGFKVIFITAHTHYAISAFKYNALDFILKPFMPKQLCETVSRVVEQIEEQQYFKKLESFFKQTAIGVNGQEKKIVLKTQEAIHVLRHKEILYLKSDNNYTEFHLVEEKSIVVAQPLKKFEENNALTGFLRVHQSYLVNLQYVKTFRKNQDCLLLDNDKKIPVSGRKRSQLLAYFNEL